MQWEACGLPLVSRIGLELLHSGDLESQIEADELKDVIKSRPQIVQIADVIPLTLSGDLAFFKVVWLEYGRDKTYFERVLDIQDAEVSSRVLSSRVMVTELTFNERKGYLCHGNALEEVELINREEQQIGYQLTGLPRNAYSCNKFIEATKDLQYFERCFSQLMKQVSDQVSPLGQQVDSGASEPIVLIGHAGSGKTHMLRLLADRVGFLYTHIDCLAHLNLNQLKTLLSETIPAQNAALPHLFELTGFEKYSLWFEGSQGQSQTKAEKDLAEMRFQHVFQQALDEMQAKCSSGGSSRAPIIFISAEKADELASLTKLLQLKRQARIDLPERADRKRILEALMPSHVLDSVDMLEIAKYLQGKTYRDMKQTVMKIKRKLPAYFNPS